MAEALVRYQSVSGREEPRQAEHQILGKLKAMVLKNMLTSC